MPATDLRPIGRSGVAATALGFGGAPLGDLYGILDEDAALGALREAVAAGLRLFDTSPLYGRGLSEHRFGTVLRHRPRDDFTLSTKVGRVLTPAPGGVRDRDGYAGGLSFEAAFDYSYDGAMRAYEQSLLRLGLPRIDLLLIHDVDRWTHGDAVERRFEEAMTGAYRALEELRHNGDVRGIGVGVNEADMCARFARAGRFDCMLLAGRYSLLEQPALDEFLLIAEQEGIGVLLGGVFNSGILATGPVPGARYNYRSAPPEILERVRRIEAICAAHGVRLAEAAIRFPLGHPAISSVVVGAVSAAEVSRNVESMAKPIPAGLWSDLKAEGLLRADAPTPA